MVRRLLMVALVGGWSFGAGGLNLPRFPRALIPRSGLTATVRGEDFMIQHGHLYVREVGSGRPRNVQRRPHLERITAFGPRLVGLTYAGMLIAFRREADGAWVPDEINAPPGRLIDVAGGNHALIAVGEGGDWYARHSDAPEWRPGDFGGVVGVTGYAHDRGFLLNRNKDPGALLDPTGARCEGRLR